MTGKEKTENYLKIIYRLQTSEGSAKGAAIATELNVSRPTVSITLKRLCEEGYVTFESNSSVILTKKGSELAISVMERYSFFTRMLKFLHVSEKIAKDDACRLEHSISDESFKALQNFFEGYMSSLPTVKGTAKLK